MAPSASPTQHYTHTGVDSRCFLCQETLPRLVKPVNTRIDALTSHAHSKVVALLSYLAEDCSLSAKCLGSFTISEDGPSTNYRNSLLFTHSNHLAISVGQGKPRFVVTCLSMQQPGETCDVCDQENMVCLAHEHCWGIAQSPVPIPLKDLTLLARATHRILPMEWKFDPTPDTVRDVNRQEVLGDLLYRVSRLPQELVNMIMAYCQGTVIASVMKARRTILHVLPRLKHGKALVDQPTYARFMTTGPVKTLKTNSAKSIPVNNKPILGIQFLLSGLGLRAVRVLYEDGCQSPWLGKFPSNGWIGTVLGNDLKALRVLADDLRILRIRFHSGSSNTVANSDPASPRVSSSRSVLWPSGQGMISDKTAVYRRTCAAHSARVAHYPGWSLCEMLSLNDPCPISGLSVHFSESRITGLEASFPGSSKMVGSEGHFALHHAFLEGEYITSAWLYDQPGTEDQMILSITTSYRRTYHFGSANAREAAAREKEPYVNSWTCLSTVTPTRITGLVVDALFDKHPNRPLANIGMAEEKGFVHPEHPNLGHSSAFEAPTQWVDRTMGLLTASGIYFVTTGSLINVARILVQKNPAPGQSVMGLQIIHHSGVIDTLGPRWSGNLRDREFITEVYVMPGTEV